MFTCSDYGYAVLTHQTTNTTVTEILPNFFQLFCYAWPAIAAKAETGLFFVLGQDQLMQRRLPQGRADDERLIANMIELTRQYGRYGYRRIAVQLRDAGWLINHKRVERLWRRAGLKVPMKQPKKGRLWINDGSCIQLRPEYRNHVWSYDFVHHRTDDGRVFRTLHILDEHSRECLAIRVK